MKYTENYGFDKPEGTDFVDVEHFNTNTELMDKLLCPEYSEVKEVTELESGEKLATGFGKIAKAVKELISHLADNVAHITSAERTNWDDANVKKHTHNNKSTLDSTTASYTTEEKTKLSGIATGANKYTHPSYTARTGVPTGNQTPGFGGTFTVTQPVSDATGHITGMNSRTVTIPSAEATTSAAGLMSASDKTKLNGIATGANKYTHPSYTARTGVPTANQTPGFGGTFTVTQPVSDATGHITGMNSRTVTIPSAEATTSAAGLMSASDKTKLNGIATGANKTTIAANLTTTVAGSALDATMGKTLYDYIENLNYCIGKFKEAKIVSRSHSELGEVKMACIPYDECAALTTSNKVAVKFTDGTVGIFKINSDYKSIASPGTWLTGSLPYVNKTTIQGGTNTLAITTSGGYSTWDDEIYASSGEVKQRIVLEISSASGALATEYRII